jgi:class 3 adenylate cyclase/tetratricopeptide (TPR) repeat protein
MLPDAPLPSLTEIETAIQALTARRDLLGELGESGEGVVKTALVALQRLRQLHPQAALVPAVEEPAVGEAPAQQLKLVSVLFLDMVGSTALSSHLDPEDVHLVMDGALAAYTAVVQSHGGRVLQYAGDNLLAVFGAPLAREDDAERAVLAGLALLAEAQVQERRLYELVPQLDTDVTFAVRVGIHSGEVLLGGGVDGDGTIRGQTVNLAARMEQHAPVAGLRISQDTWRLVRGRFVVEESPPLMVKGHPEPMQTYLVRGTALERSQVLRGVDGVAIALVGRQAELVQLAAALAAVRRAAAGPGPSSRQRFVLLSGEPGVGKTRLCTEFIAQALREQPETLVMRVQAEAGYQSTPYALLRRLFAQTLVGLAAPVAAQPSQAWQAPSPSVATWLACSTPLLRSEGDAAVLGKLLGHDLATHPEVLAMGDDPRQLRDRGRFHAWQLLRRLATPGPLIVWLDDLQWCDDATLEFLDWIAQQPGELPVLWLCTGRPEFAARLPDWRPQPCEDIALHPLADEHNRTLAANLLAGLQPAPVPTELLVLLTGHSEGNPYFMEEIVNTLIDRGVLDPGQQPWTCDLSRLRGLRLPTTLAGLLQARLDALPAEVRKTAQLASVVGYRFWDDSLSAVDAPLPHGLDGMVERTVVLPEPGRSDAALAAYHFQTHSLQQVAYDSVLKRVRRGLHIRVARWLEQHASVAPHELIAEHFERGGDPQAALRHWQLAADTAAAQFANAQVMAHTDRALALLPADAAEQRYELLFLQAEAQAVLDDGHRRGQCLNELVRLAENLSRHPPKDGEAETLHARLAKAYGLMTRFHADKGRFAEAQMAGEQAVEVAESCSPSIRAQALARLAQVHFRCARYAEAEHLLDRARDSASKGDDISTLAMVHNDLGNLKGDLGDLSASLINYQEAARLYEQTNHKSNQLSVRGNLGYCAMQLGMYAEGLAEFEYTANELNDLGDVLTAAISRINLAMVLLRTGEPSAAAQQAERVLSDFQQQNDAWIIASAQRVLGLAYSQMGEWRLADELLHRSAENYGFLGLTALSCEATSGRLDICLISDNHQNTVRFLEKILNHVSEPWDFAGAEEPVRAMLVLYRALNAVGDDRAPKVLQAARDTLLNKAATISEQHHRDSYLYAVTEHRMILDFSVQGLC